MSSPVLTQKKTLDFIITLLKDEEQEALNSLHSINWEEFYNIAIIHKVAPIVFSKLITYEWPPVEVCMKMRNFIRANKLYMLKIYAEKQHINTFLTKIGVAHYFLKGPDLSIKLYGDFSKRQSKDLDLYVPINEVDSALELLEQKGYCLIQHYHSSKKQKEIVRSTYNDYKLYNAISSVFIELHWHAIPPLYFENRILNIICPIKENELKFKSKDELIYLCIHGAYHRWKRLIWSYDIYMYLNSLTEEEVNGVYERAKSLQVLYFFLDAIFLCERLYGYRNCLKASDFSSSRVKKLVKNACKVINYQKKMKRAGLLERWWQLQGEFLLGGIRLVFKREMGLFIQPIAWGVFAFSDRFFFLNYLLSPLMMLVIRLKNRILKIS